MTTQADQEQVGGNHYKEQAVQPWAAMESWMTPEQFVGFLRGNAIKYLARADKKGGLEDIKKAQHYINKLVEVSEKLEEPATPAGSWKAYRTRGGAAR